MQLGRADVKMLLLVTLDHVAYQEHFTETTFAEEPHQHISVVQQGLLSKSTGFLVLEALEVPA